MAYWGFSLLRGYCVDVWIFQGTLCFVGKSVTAEFSCFIFQGDLLSWCMVVSVRAGFKYLEILA